MYTIILLFESNEKGIYTKEIETANDIKWVKKKVHRMLFRWLFNLECDLDCWDMSDTWNHKMNVIQKRIHELNENDNGNRTFNIIVDSENVYSSEIYEIRYENNME